ncbi:MAG: roadblock/LC7 domain-containing protein [Candidatus Helarchaeales archaeon]
MGEPPEPMKLPDISDIPDLGDLGDLSDFQFGVVPTGDKPQKLTEILKELESNIPEIEAAAIVSAEGLPIASALPRDVDEARVAAMTAAILSLGERAAAELSKGELEQVMIRGSEGYLISMAVGENAVLTVSATKKVRLGLIFLDMKRTVEKLLAELES